jgi:hypothetical protein
MNGQINSETFATMGNDQNNEKEILGTIPSANLVNPGNQAEYRSGDDYSPSEKNDVENPILQPVREDIPSGKNIMIIDSLDELTNNHDQTSDVVAPGSSSIMNSGSLAELLEHEDSAHYRARWIEIQTRFIDDPRSAVSEADGLVSEVVEKITQLFSEERKTLEGQWKVGSDVSTEDLRKALQHYRSFFNRLVV